ncbi:uncharacterized protein LOC113350878 [Papaver somniferum]|uniref:uncharacterized protein LOC113350878 n=1 Tax=Papaver somniferum TaxID=3469 RepID=UPI000E6FF5E1|nr:uncharacterized protein LOC113350878 [Papaver somniferum]
MEISLHALTGHVAQDTIRVPGLFNKHDIIVLVDTSSTHSFLDAHLAEKLQLHIKPTGHILVIVANGDTTLSIGLCPALNWSMQGHQFSGDLRVLPLGGCDMVLGVDWLKQLGDVTFNLAQLKLSFVHLGHKITLQGSSTTASLRMLSGSSIRKFIKSKTPALIGHFFCLSARPLSPVPPEITSFLSSFTYVFDTPTSLPPNRVLDHKIPLKPNSEPTSQRPYRCPYVQKSIVEKLVHEMLDSGLIQNSHSPFAAPILLVKKKDGSWRFRVDYRKLNKMTVKDKFPIPLIGELLDDLNGAITAEGVAADSDKIASMVSWPTPSTLKQLRGFLGLTALDAFMSLKQDMVTAPVLALPDFSKPFVLETNACSTGVGDILMQLGKPIAFYSKALGPKALALSTYEKKLLAIVMEVQKWKHYLSNNHFIIYIDHQSLKFFMEQRITSVLQQKWLMKLLGFDYVIKYKKGLDNKADDALSRIPHAASECLAMCKGILYIGSSNDIRASIMHYVNSSAVEGHSGMTGTYNRAKAYCYWPRMKQDILQFAIECDVCQSNKGERLHPAGLLQPPPIPDTIWQHMSMEFIEGLPLSNKKNVILVVVERLTKYSHSIALAHPFTASSVAKEFLQQVFKLHGLPTSIISDRDKIFVSQFWQELFKLLGTTIHLSTSYHPQIDGQTERSNACLEQYLRCMSGSSPKNW